VPVQQHGDFGDGGDLIEVFKMFMGLGDNDLTTFFTLSVKIKWS